AAGETEDVADGELGGGDDVGGRRVDDHGASGGRRLDVDIVQADSGAGDDLQPGRVRQRLRVDLRGRAHQYGVGVHQRGEQCWPVRTVDLSDVEVGAQSLARRWGEDLGEEDDGIGR